MVCGARSHPSRAHDGYDSTAEMGTCIQALEDREEMKTKTRGGVNTGATESYWMARCKDDLLESFVFLAETPVLDSGSMT
jgi:hypothetical protein